MLMRQITEFTSGTPAVKKEMSLWWTSGNTTLENVLRMLITGARPPPSENTQECLKEVAERMSRVVTEMEMY